MLVLPLSEMHVSQTLLSLELVTGRLMPIHGGFEGAILCKNYFWPLSG
jgi:hypothetical protein